MADPRTLRARADQRLSDLVDAAMLHEGRTESDIVRRALYAYLTGPETPVHTSGFAAAGKTFKGPDPKGGK